MTISASDDKVGVLCVQRGEQRVDRREFAAIWPSRGLDPHPVALKVVDQRSRLLARPIRLRREGKGGHLPGARKKWHCVVNGARRFAARLPSDQNIFADGAWLPTIWQEQHWNPAG